MALSDALAIVGAATGISGTTLGVMAFVRDRARLYVRLVYEGRATFLIYIVNAGRQPVAVLHVGLRRPQKGLVPPPTEPGMPMAGYTEPASRRPWTALRRGRRGYATWEALPESAEPLVLQPGELARFAFSDPRPDEDKWTDAAPDEIDWAPIQAFVEDFRGRRAFSNELMTSPEARFTLVADRTHGGASD
jgi:hypothetical protein